MPSMIGFHLTIHPPIQFVRYISFYIDMEWKAISAQNKGKGVVLAATWVSKVRK